MTGPTPLDEARALGENPIPGAVPAGCDPDGTPAFEAMMAEISKLSGMGGAPVDWAVVTDQATHVLGNQAKDLRAAAYLARGLMESHGLPGLGRGVETLTAIVDSHWEDCWPTKRRARGRTAAIVWLAERVAPVLAARFVDGTDGPALTALRDQLRDLERKLGDRLGEGAPDLGDLMGVVSERLRAAEAGEEMGSPPKEATSAPVASRAGGATGGTASTSVVPPSSGQASTTLATLPPLDPSSDRVVKRIFTEASSALRSQDLGNPLFYHMVRYATWRSITEAPPATDGRTQLAPVPPDRVAQYDKMLNSRHHEDLITAAEQSVARNPFWLTGQRLVDQALNDLGHAAAQRAVRHELRIFVSRVPAVLELRFSDGTPFADPATRDWVTDVVLAPPAAPGGGPAAGGRDGGDWRAMLEATRAAAKPDDLADLLARLEDAAVGETEPRRRFLWSLAQARVCLENGFLALARTQFEYLEGVFTQRGLGAWEPSLGADLAAALEACRADRPRPLPPPSLTRITPTPLEKD
jgi:type VI secretion system protein VasJ